MLLFLLELIIRIAVQDIQLPGLDRKILKDSIYYCSPGLQKNSSGTSNGILKAVDSNGFWKFYSDQSKKAKRKILLLGDSATMGIGVENDSTFAGLLNILLKDAIVYNSALIGYSSEDYLNIAQHCLVDKYNKLGITDIFIFWCLNDIYSNFPDEDSPEYKPDLVKKITGFLSRNFKLYHFVKNTFSDRPKDYFEYDKSFYWETKDHFKKSINNLMRIKTIASSRNLGLHLFLLPYEYQLRKNSAKGIFIPQKLLKNNLKNTINQITDLRKAFDSTESNFKNFYLYGDGIHFSNAGHRVIAKHIASIQEQKP